MAATRAVREVVHVVRDRELTFMAASIAHYALASIVPLLLLALSLATLVGEQALVEWAIERQLAAVLSESGRQVLRSAVTDLQGQVGAGIAGLVVALWSGSKVFRGLSVAFARVYGRDHTPSLFEQVRDAVTVTGLLLLAIAAMIAMGLVVSFVPLPVDNPALVGTAFLLATLVLFLLPIYYVLTPVDATVRDVLPGTLVAALGLIALQVGFLYYARNASQYKVLGVLGAVLLFVTWLYFGGIVILVGGAVNYVNGTSGEVPASTDDPSGGDS